MVVVNEQRRVSARIQEKQREEKQREEKLRLAKRRAELLSDDKNIDKGAAAGNNDGKNTRGNACGRKRGRRVKDVENVKEAEAEAEAEEEGKEKGPVETTTSVAEGVNGNVVNIIEKSDTATVKKTLRLFNKYYLRVIKEEEQRCGTKVKADGKASKKSKAKKGGVLENEDRTKAKRPDLKAISEMMKNNEILYSKKRIGDLPGVNVGHQFYSRAEMVAVGFHSHWLNGIDYMGVSYKGEYENYTFPIAVAIVLSGMYEDDLDNAEDVVYTGQGGHNLTGDKRQIRDQVLERGNLALKNCVDQGVPVRVIRGHESSSSYTGKVYTYDGLYKVVQYWAEKGLSGFTVFKYRLRRIEGQPILTTNQVHFVNGRVPHSLSEIRGLVCEDISGGQEAFPIPATNLVDDPPVAPTGFTYYSSMQVAKSVKLPTSTIGCGCKGNCINSRDCSCAKLNSLDSKHYDFPYVHRNGGRLIEAKAVVFECGPKCACGPDCINRTSQMGLKYRLEVYRTPKKGWAVRSWDFIPSGAPVSEYIGVLKSSEDPDITCDNENNFIFDIDCLQTMRGLGGRERRLRDVSLSTIYNSDRPDDQKVENIIDYCIDAGLSGNVSRFINHSCEPNLFVQCVLSSHHDIKLARVVLFAADNIPPLQELTYDYGYELDSVHGPDGKVKQMTCYCGAEGCRGRLF